MGGRVSYSASETFMKPPGGKLNVASHLTRDRGDDPNRHFVTFGVMDDGFLPRCDSNAIIASLPLYEFQSMQT